MRKNACNGEAPSTKADSSSSIGQLPEDVAQDQHGEGHDEGGVGQDQRQLRVQQAQRLHEQEEGDDRGHGRQEALRQEPQGHVLVLPAAEAEAGQPVAGQGAEADGDQRGAAGDDQAVEQGAADLRPRVMYSFCQLNRVGLNCRKGISEGLVRMTAGGLKEVMMAQ